MVQKAKFEYSPLGQVFNKGLNIDERNEGLLKSLKNIEGKNEQQLPPLILMEHNMISINADT